MSRRLALAAVLAAVAVAAGVALVARRDDAATRSAASAKTPYAVLVARNYRVLRVAQSRRLLAFADAFRSCLVTRGIGLGKPEPQPTKIVMSLPAGTERRALARLSVQCATPLGGPPPGASLVQPPDGKTIELYLPKQCLLDRKVAADARSR
jgi:hypothetical protein